MWVLLDSCDLICDQTVMGSLCFGCFGLVGQVAIPVVPTVRVVITFTKFVELQPVELFYTPLSSPRHLLSVDDDHQEPESRHRSSFSASSMSWLRRNNSQSGSKQQHQLDSDPFAIPAGYAWTTSGDDSSGKLKKSKSMRRSK